MARGPNPKDPKLRQRRNKSSTRATLPSVEEAAENEIPPLFERERRNEAWHPRVIEWWNAAWTSPMASEWLDADVLGVVYRTAELQQDFWMAPDARGRIAVESRIAKNEEKLGLSPIDRRRLQWEIEKGEQAEQRTKKRRGRAKADPTKDPRQQIRAVP